jgi:hypothetical protein
LISEQPARIEDEKRRFRRAIEIEGGPRPVMSYAARVFISSPKRKQGACWKLPIPVSVRTSIVSKLSIELAFMY